MCETFVACEVCGATGRYAEMFDDSALEPCDGLGNRICKCGGEECICHHHGRAECNGCEACESQEDFGDGIFDDYHEDDRWRPV